jgi:hypothetical protein
VRPSEGGFDVEEALGQDIERSVCLHSGVSAGRRSRVTPETLHKALVVAPRHCELAPNRRLKLADATLSHPLKSSNVQARPKHLRFLRVADRIRSRLRPRR